MAKILQGEDLLKRATELGVDTQGDPIYQSRMGRHKLADENVLQDRVMRAEDSIRQNRLWILALVSAIAAVLSAAAAFSAVFWHK